MERKKDEQMIYFKDLIFAALRRWKGILAVSLVFAVLLGSYKGISGLTALSDQAALSADIAKQQDAAVQYEANKSALEQEIEDLQKSITNQQAYLDNSVLMQLDPYCFYEASLNLYVQTGYKVITSSNYQDPDKTNTVLSAYQSVISSSSSIEAIANTIDTEPQYVQELLTTDIYTATDTMTVRIKAASAEDAEALLALLVQQVENAYAEVSSVAAHTVQVVKRSVSTRLDLTMADTQTQASTRMNTLLAALNTAQTELTELSAPAELSTTTSSAVLKKAILFAVAGAVLGAFLAVCAVWVMHITSGKVYSARTLNNRTGVKILGGVVCKKFPTALDRFLHKLEGRNVSDRQAQLELLSVDIRCRAQGVQKLLVTGSAKQSDREALVLAIRQAMPGVTVEDHGDLLKASAAREALVSCDRVILVEQCGVSLYRNVDSEAALILDYNKALIGCVLLDG